MLIEGLVPDQTAKLLTVEQRGANAISLVYERTADGGVGKALRFRNEIQELKQTIREWSFDGDGSTFRLVSEAFRIRLAHLFDPVLAIHTSLVEPLPHQITAVYEEMLTRYPLRFLLADDPGAGKTIMAGLLIRELMVRGDVQRCLICVPGKLSYQWKDELKDKFRLEFEVIEGSAANSDHNEFRSNDLAIVSVDRAKRKERIEQLKSTTWDLVICDEAHQFSAQLVGNRINKTQRYRLGELLGKQSRHFLLLTATPHNGKEGDFRLFLKLLDRQRFKNNDVIDQNLYVLNRIDAADLMRRMVKEELRRFDGKPLFPERMAYTVNFELSGLEQDLYEAVSDYIREGFDRAKRLEKRHGNIVGFAMTVLLRRLASSPMAIYQSLKSRKRRQEEQLKLAEIASSLVSTDHFSESQVIDEEIENLTARELELLEDKISASVTTAFTIPELETEIATLTLLVEQAKEVCESGQDKKWEELRSLFDMPDMQNSDGTQRKLVIFTEHVATLEYLIEKLQTVFPHPNAIVTIHGKVNLAARRHVEYEFRTDPDVLILVATDAAGEGINLQCANLMVNYDLPWNPNRLEQRFGRIHRIGQKEVCHLWNLVANKTLEGAVYSNLLHKLENMNEALGGKVFDVLGELFSETSLKDLLVKAIEYGNDPEVRARLDQAIDNSLDQERVSNLLRRKALTTDTLDLSKIPQLQEDLETAQKRRLQLEDIKAFFFEAFRALGGKIDTLLSEPGRFAINHVPADIRNYAKDRELKAVQNTYRRICFDKELINIPDRAEAEFICPGHPLLDAIVSLILERKRDILKRGAIFVDEGNTKHQPRILFYLQQEIIDATPSRNADQRTISREIHFLELGEDGHVFETDLAPYLDYRPASHEEREHAKNTLNLTSVMGLSLEKKAIEYAVEKIVPNHLSRVRSRRVRRINKIGNAIQELRRRQNKQFEFEKNELLAVREGIEAIEAEREYREHLEERQSLYAVYKSDENRRKLEALGLPELLKRVSLGLLPSDIRDDHDFLEEQEEDYWDDLENLERALEETIRQQKLLEEQLQRREQELNRERWIHAEAPLVTGGALIIPARLLPHPNRPASARHNSATASSRKPITNSGAAHSTAARASSPASGASRP